MPVTTNPKERVSRFFESYSHALENFDSKLMTMHFMLPATMISDDNTTVFTEASVLEGMFNQAIGFYKQNGILHARPEVWSKHAVTERIMKVKVNWQYFDAQNKPLYNCDDHYILRLDKHDEWKIQVLISVNEKQHMEEWMAKKQLG